MCCSTPGSSALHYLLESAQILVHWVVIYILKCISNKIFIRVVCWKWKSAHEKNQHTWIDILCSWIRTLNTVRTSILLTLIYRFNILPLKLQKDFFFFYINVPQRNRCCCCSSLQSCPTLCDPIDGSPPGSPVPGILQARTLEWVAISFSSEVAQSCPTLSDPMDCSLPGSSIHGIFQARQRNYILIIYGMQRNFNRYYP